MSSRYVPKAPPPCVSIQMLTLYSASTAVIETESLIYESAAHTKHLVVAIRAPPNVEPDWLEQDSPMRSPWDAFTVRRLDDRWIHCAFLPTGPGRLSYPRGPLDVLNYTFDTLPLREVQRAGKTQYLLQERVERGWASLEKEISVLIHEACRVWNVALPLEYDPKMDFRPSRYKFNVPDPDANKFRRRANQARASFAVQLALFTMLLAMAKVNGLFDFRDLYRHTDISPVFIDAITGCWAGDLHRPCVGTIIDVTFLPATFAKTQWYRYARSFLQVTKQLPLWLDYGTNPALDLRTLMPISREFFPRSEKIKAAMEAFIHHAQEQAYQSATLYPSIFEWLTLCEQEYRDVAFTEEQIDHMRRIAREEEQALQPTPGPRGPRIFLWEQAEHGTWLRYQVLNDRQSFIRQLWADTTPAMRRYNSIRHEYDVCHALDPSWRPPFDFNDDFSWEDELLDLDASVPEPYYPAEDTQDMAIQRLLEAGGKYEYDADLVIQQPDIIAAIKLRYSLLDVPGHTGSTRIHASGRLPWKRCLAILRLDSRNPPAFSSGLQAVISDFVSSLDKEQRPPGDLVTIRPGSLRHGQRPMYAQAVQINEWASRKHLRCGTGPINNTDWEPTYRIHRLNIPADSPGYFLVVHSPIDAVTVLQLSGATTGFDSYGAAEWLLSYGISFRTLSRKRPGLEYNKPQPRPARIGLGYRLHSYTFTRQDYFAYEMERDRLLNTSVGRAALMAGGLVWRLAYSAVGEQQVLFGPTHCESTHIIATFDGIDFVDDVLTEEQVDIVCGVYHIFQRKYETCIYKSC